MMSSGLWKTYDYSGSGIEIAESFKDERHLFFLDSSAGRNSIGRYSFIGYGPFDTVSANGKDSFGILKEKYSKYASEEKCGITPFHSGIVGCLSYDLGCRFENIYQQKKSDLDIPHCFFGFYDSVITIDHGAQKLHISSTGLGGIQKEGKLRELDARISRIFKKHKHQQESACEFYGENDDIRLASDFAKAEYIQSVRKALDYIKNGDIYQVNLSQRFYLDNKEGLEPIELFKTLRKISPSSFGGYFDGGSFQVVSSSPERFLKCKDGFAETRPMKGTRPRGTDEAQDILRRSELENSQKDISELLMITDLERNDLGRVCEFGSVKVRDMRTIEEYSTVYQATSTVEGRLSRDKDVFDLLKACFPGGSITGCPKIRSMEIIEEIEPVHRSLYTGAFGYISFSGDMDFSILIRTLVNYQDKIYFHVGSGIVSDSTPEDEYEETMVKAKALIESLKRAAKQHNKTLTSV